jgi:hypothetical protein
MPAHAHSFGVEITGRLSAPLRHAYAFGVFSSEAAMQTWSILSRGSTSPISNVLGTLAAHSLHNPKSLCKCVKRLLTHFWKSLSSSSSGSLIRLAVECPTSGLLITAHGVVKELVNAFRRRRDYLFGFCSTHVFFHGFSCCVHRGVLA